LKVHSSSDRDDPHDQGGIMAIDRAVLEGRPVRPTLRVLAGGAFLVACCLVGPLLVGVACVFALGVFGELAAVAVLLATWAVVLQRRRTSRGHR
jgi:hypothetical protein